MPGIIHQACEVLRRTEGGCAVSSILHGSGGEAAKDNGNNWLCFIYPPKTPPLGGADFARQLQNNNHATLGYIKKFLAIPKVAEPTRCFSWLRV